MGTGRDAARSGRLRVALGVIGVVAAVGATVGVGYRVLAPAEVVTPATVSYPVAATPPGPPGVIGTFSSAPLVVDGRIRVYAAQRQLKADLPASARTMRSPFWSYRRWPAELVGAAAVGTTVIGRWSDGQLTGIDGRTGRVAWKTDGPVPDTREFVGRRTGAATVYRPAGLYTADGVVIGSGTTGTVAVDAETGDRLWSLPAEAGRCRVAAFTTAAGHLVSAGRCAGQAVTLTFYNPSTGRVAGRWSPTPTDQVRPDASVTPAGCRLGHSGCSAVRLGAADQASAWLLPGPRPVRAPALDPSTAWWISSAGTKNAPASPATSGQAVTVEADSVLARPATGGDPVWRWPGAGDGARVLAVRPGRVHVLTAGYELVTLDAASGAVISRYLCTYGKEKTGWTPGHAYADSGLLLVERLAAEPDPTDDDRAYYFTAQPVLLASV